MVISLYRFHGYPQCQSLEKWSKGLRRRVWKPCEHLSEFDSWRQQWFFWKWIKHRIPWHNHICSTEFLNKVMSISQYMIGCNDQQFAWHSTSHLYVSFDRLVDWVMNSAHTNGQLNVESIHILPGFERHEKPDESNWNLIDWRQNESILCVSARRTPSERAITIVCDNDTQLISLYDYIILYDILNSKLFVDSARHVWTTPHTNKMVWWCVGEKRSDDCILLLGSRSICERTVYGCVCLL